MFVTLVSEWPYIVSITQFERSVTESNVCFLCGFCGDLGLIDDAFHITVTIHGTLVVYILETSKKSLAVSFVSNIARPIISGVALNAQPNVTFYVKKFLKESNCFTSTSTSRTYPITQILSCKSKNVIYLVTCKKCNVQYVGSLKFVSATTSLPWSLKNVLVKLLFISTKNLMLSKILNF